MGYGPSYGGPTQMCVPLDRAPLLSNNGGVTFTSFIRYPGVTF